MEEYPELIIRIEQKTGFKNDDGTPKYSVFNTSCPIKLGKRVYCKKHNVYGRLVGIELDENYFIFLKIQPPAHNGRIVPAIIALPHDVAPTVENDIKEQGLLREKDFQD